MTRVRPLPIGTVTVPAPLVAAAGVVVVVVLAVGLALSPVATSAASADPGGSTTSTTQPAPAAASTKPGGMTVVSQTAWVGAAPNNQFKISLRLGATMAPASQVTVTVYSRLVNRTNFDATLSGRIRGAVDYQQSVSLASLPRSAGAIQLTLPVGPSQTGGGTGPGVLPPDDNVANGENFVYPVQIAATDSQGRPVGQPVITYLVWAPSPSGLPKLDVSLVLPAHAAPSLGANGSPVPLSSAAVSGLQDEAQTLSRHPGVPATLAITPQTLDALAADGKSGQAVVAALAGAVKATGDEALPETYVRTNVGGMTAAGLGSEVSRQLDAGEATSSKLLVGAMNTSTWAVDGPVDGPTVAALQARGATQLVVPSTDLSALPADLQQTTFAQPARLFGSNVEVVGADTGLDAHFTNGGDQVLQADQLLAELAMIETEQPSVVRGVAVLPPDGWQPSSMFLQVLLAGLEGNPLLSAVTAHQLFLVPAAMTPGRDAALTRSLVTSPVPPFADASAISGLRSRINALASTLSVGSGQLAGLDKQLLVAESSDLSDRQRMAAVGALNRALSNGFAGLQLPKNVSVTLTSNSGTVPITILNGAGTAHVRLDVSSQKLTFRPFTPPGGSCQITASSTETCALTLSGPSVIIRLPVEARATGVFSLNLDLLTRDGSAVISHARYTVRSTAISGVAVILTVGAVVLLALWWVRDRRHGRRARQLVPAAPQADERGSGEEAPAPATAQVPVPAAPATAAPAAVDEERWLNEDPVVARFFASEPPEYGDPARDRDAPDPPGGHDGDRQADSGEVRRAR